MNLTLFLFFSVSAILTYAQDAEQFKISELPADGITTTCKDSVNAIEIVIDIALTADNLKIIQDDSTVLTDEQVTRVDNENIATFIFANDFVKSFDGDLFLVFQPEGTPEPESALIKIVPCAEDIASEPQPGPKENPKESPQANQGKPDASITAYHEVITNILKKRRTHFAKYTLANSKDTTYIFLNRDLRPIDGTVIPDCNPRGTYYQIYVIAPEGEFSGAEFILEDNFQSDGFKIDVGHGTSKGEIKLQEYHTEFPQGPFQSGVDFNIVLFKKEDGKDVYETEHSFTIPSCDQPIHVSILGGFYFSTLNDPTEITQGTIPESSAITLYANNSKNQRALSVMALFYPTPRVRNYAHKDLTFMQKWGIVFGTKLSQDLFNDLLLGINYEFAKGAGFTTGLHYGEHTVIRGYDNFIFGETEYTGPTFTNDVTNRQWDFGWFFGVTIDFRVIAAMRIAGNRENNLNNNSTEE